MAFKVEGSSYTGISNVAACKESNIVILGHQVELPPSDLGTTSSLTQTLQLLQDILSSHDSSVIAIDARKQDFAQVTHLAGLT